MATEKEITVVAVRPQERAEVIKIENTLAAKQEFIGGYIETIFPFEDPNVVLICNEEGKIAGLTLNRLVEMNGVRDIIAGSFLIAGVDDEEGEFISLTPEQQQEYQWIFEEPEYFVQTAKGIHVLYEPPIENEPISY